jgi:O-acetyl-ADP-ribose deacetylase (regulator of RNase III)
MRLEGWEMNLTLRESAFTSGQKLEICQGDITTEETDAIVNAANRYLEHGAGVAGAIIRRGGSQIQAESRRWVLEHGLVTHSEPAYTHAGNLHCRYIIHAVGPAWGEGDEVDKLGAAIRGSLQVAVRLGLDSIAFPAISTGIFGFPKPLAAQLMLSTIQNFLAANPSSNIKLVRLVLFDPETLQAFLNTWDSDDHLRA